MAEVLSQNEVESLLSALEPSGSSSGSGGSYEPTPANRSSRELAGQISVYDFKRPERVSKEQMRAFQGLHESFSRDFGAALSGMLRSIVEVKLISVDQLTYSEFVFSLENPTCFNLLRSRGLDGHIILDLNPSIIYPIVDRLLGGGKSTSSDFPNRPLTEIELRLVSRITRLAIQSLESFWVNIVELQLEVQQIESNPQLVQIVPPNEVIVLISFEITLGESRGIMNLCIPFNTIEPLAGKLSSDSWSAYSKKEFDLKQLLELKESVKGARVGVKVELAKTTISTRDIVQMDVGDVILTEVGVQSGARVLIEGHPMFRANPGLAKGHKAIEVKERITPVRDHIEQEYQRIQAEKAARDSAS